MSNLAATIDSGEVVLDHMVAALVQLTAHLATRKMNHRRTSDGAKPCPIHTEGRETASCAIADVLVVAANAAMGAFRFYFTA